MTFEQNPQAVLLGMALTAALILSGCRTTPTASGRGHDQAAPTAGESPSDGPGGQPDLGNRADHQRGRLGRRTPVSGSLSAGASVEGRPIPYSVHGSGLVTVLLLATIHGDEDAGTPLLERLAKFLESDAREDTTTRVVIVPVLNPDGLSAHSRLNARGVDLNRNFPAANRRERAVAGTASLSEPESEALHELIERYHPQRIVSIHGWVGVVDWDGPASELAQRVGALCGLPAQRIGSRPGSLGSFIGVDQGIPILTLELPSHARSMDPGELWETYGEALLAFIRWTPARSS